MKTLFFKKHFMEQIKAGQKTSTLRVRNRLHITKGDQVLCLSGRDKLAIEITDARKIFFEELSDEIVKKEGFTSKDDLVKTLREIYPSIDLNTLFLFDFTLL